MTDLSPSSDSSRLLISPPSNYDSLLRSNSLFYLLREYVSSSLLGSRFS